MKYGYIEKETNKLLGWYDDSIHKNIPIPKIPVTDDEHSEYIKLNVNYYNKETKKFEVKDFKTNEEIKQEFEFQFRKQRDNLLIKVVDFYQKPLVWENLSKEKQEDIRQYRNDLLNSTKTFTLPSKPVWIN